MATEHPAPRPEAPHETPPAGDGPKTAIPPARIHLSETIHKEQWLRLLIVLTTLLMLFLVVAVTVRLLASIGHTLLIFSLGGLLAYALDPLVERVRHRPDATGRRRSRAKSALLVFGGIFGLVTLAGLLLSATAYHQVTTLAREHDLYEAHARARLADADNWFAAHNIKLNLSDYLNNPPPNVRTWGEAVAQNTLRMLEHLSKDIVEALIVVLIALYFLIYSEEMRAGINHALPERLLPYVNHWQDDVNHILGGFVRGQLLLALTIGAMATVICYALGLKLWLLIGLFVMVAAFIPVVGPFIGAIPAVIAALVSPDAHFHPAVRVALLLIGFGVINEVGSKILYPRLVGGALGLHEVLVLFILFAGFEVGGLTGVLFAAPLTALAVVTLTHLYRLWQGLPPVSVAQAARQGGMKAKARGVP
jgi:predicted PurR-regulated permease PerM